MKEIEIKLGTKRWYNGISYSDEGYPVSFDGVDGWIRADIIDSNNDCEIKDRIIQIFDSCGKETKEVLDFFGIYYKVKVTKEVSIFSGKEIEEIDFVGIDGTPAMVRCSDFDIKIIKE